MMSASSLSRWTMAYFAAALFFLISAQVLMASGYGFPTASIEAPETLVVVHMVTIGWLSLLMCGALFQFVPVLVAQPLRDSTLALPALLCLLAGLLCLLGGFLQTAGTIDLDIPFLAFGGLFLPSGFALVIWTIGRTLWSVPKSGLSLPARFVAVGLTCAAAAVALGASFAWVLSGHAPALAGTDVLAFGLPVHVAMGLGGWLGFTAIGVSYRLLPMFMLSPDREHGTGRFVLWAGASAWGFVLLARPFAVVSGSAALPTGFAGVLILVATVFFAFDLIFFYRHRRRGKIELNVKSAIGAFLVLYCSILLILILVAAGTFAEHVDAVVYIVGFGCLTGLGLSMLYKIVPFLTWLECYGPVMGRVQTPRVQDLVVESRDRVFFTLYYAGMLLGTGALLVGAPILFRVATAMTLLATMAIVAELVVARRLVNVGATLRLPEGASRPRLFLPHWHAR